MYFTADLCIELGPYLHHRLARTDIALDQPQHGMGAGQIGLVDIHVVSLLEWILQLRRLAGRKSETISCG